MDEYLRDALIMIRRAHVNPGGGGLCRRNYPSACDVCIALRMLDKAEAVIGAVQARMAAFVEYNRVRSESASADEWELVRNAYHNALMAENLAVANWEKVKDANQSNAT